MFWKLTLTKMPKKMPNKENQPLSSTSANIVKPRGPGRKPKRSMNGALSNNPGRPRKPVEDLSDRSTRRRALEFVENASLDYLRYVMKYGTEKLQAIDEANNIDEEDELLGRAESDKNSALALYLGLKIAKRRYIELRHYLNLHKSLPKNALPSYKTIVEQKKKLLPEGMQVTEALAIVPLQNLLNKTGESLISAVKDQFTHEDLSNCVINFSYGFDGSSGYKNTHQVMEEENETNATHLSLFLTSVTLLSINFVDTGKKWLNATPQSTRFCRPLRMSFEKETKESILRERDRVQNEITNLVDHKYQYDPNIPASNISFDLKLTGVDGKCLNAFLHIRSTVCCPICTINYNAYHLGLHPNVDCSAQPGHLMFGLGLLHCNIRTLEFLLTLSYKLLEKSWANPEGE